MIHRGFQQLRFQIRLRFLRRQIQVVVRNLPLLIRPRAVQTKYYSFHIHFLTPYTLIQLPASMAPCAHTKLIDDSVLGVTALRSTEPNRI